MVLVADAALRLQRIVTVSEGTSNATLVEPRDVIAAVLQCKGSAFALAHNHPGGSLRPSQQDVRSTHIVAAAADLMGLRFLQHVVITEDGWTDVLDPQ
jgi:DNA repair protein RadC